LRSIPARVAFARAGSPEKLPGKKSRLPSRRQFHEEGMGKILRKTIISIGLVVFCQAASASLDSRVAMDAGSSVYPNVPQLGLLAQAGEPPAANPATPLPDSKAPQDQSPPSASPPPSATATEDVVRPAKSASGCALKFMAAEVAGKLKGRKWKEFREEECAASNMQAVFPTAIAPKYSGANPDKARTLTCADQFNANKAANANGGMKWIESSGGYYSECISRLKG
jgi:hypothetical protein